MRGLRACCWPSFFSDVIAGELACRLVRGAGADGDAETYRQTTRNIIRRYGADVHRSFA